ncbi:MAG: hypothetical protein H6953_02670 [Chromatiaceae bacterium]|nr:hypothetical protein [Gammaproteobacteria bacterium]MCP5304329.1 hypothetical protein [Chromatiaceae bacterium]MCP5314054.1 hypothetical protein [Chromatiaceae bacterium]
MAEKTPNIHKTILILILVFVPPYWLIFTDEGARISDRALLWLVGEDEIKLNLRVLSPAYSRADIEKVFGDIDWKCGAKNSPFGDALCVAKVGAFNGYPARALTLYFLADKLSAMQLVYRGPYHEQLLGHLIDQLGQPTNVAAAVSEGPDAADVLEWGLEHGKIVLKKKLQQGDEPSLLWVAGAPAA